MLLGSIINLWAPSLAGPSRVSHLLHFCSPQQLFQTFTTFLKGPTRFLSPLLSAGSLTSSLHGQSRCPWAVQLLLLSWPQQSALLSRLLSRFTPVSGKEVSLLTRSLMKWPGTYLLNADWWSICQTLGWVPTCPQAALASRRSQVSKQTRNKQQDSCHNKCKDSY